MKITAPALALAILATLVDAAPKTGKDSKFNATAAHDGADKPGHIKTAANLMGSGAKIQLCPTGDCTTGQAIMLSMARLEEISAADANDTSKTAVQVAPNFQALDATWTDFAPLVINGTDTLSASFVTTFRVKGAVDDTSFNLTAVIYQANGTAMNGNQTIDVPAGALKFSVTIGKWPFKDPANRLRFGVELKATGKNSTERDPGSKRPKGGKAKDVDRLSMGEGMFMDAPTQAVVDGVNTVINGSVVPKDKKQELVWVFPSFTKELFYDPVMGVDNSTSSGTGANDTTTTTNTTQAPSTTVAPKSGAGMVASVLAAGVLAVATAFFV